MHIYTRVSLPTTLAVTEEGRGRPVHVLIEFIDSSSSEVGSAGDVVQALLDYLVNPMLPLKASGREAPSLSQQQSVAKPAEMAGATVKSCVTECRGEKVDTGNKISSTLSSDQDGMPIGDCVVVPFQTKRKYAEKLQVTLASKENALLQTALKVLLMKREKLSYHLRNIEEEIAVCEKNIQTILDGGEGDIALKIEAIIDCCNEVCLKGKAQTQDGTCQHVEDRCSPECLNGKKLTEAILTLRSPSQDLDDICYENNWTLPTYRVSLSDGAFLANATLKGMDFECFCGSGLHSNPREARESAAAQMIAKLRSMVGQTY